MIISGSAGPGLPPTAMRPLSALRGAKASVTPAKWITPNTCTQHTIHSCTLAANYHMPQTSNVTCNNQNAIHQIFLCKHTLLHMYRFYELLEDKNHFIFIFYSHSNFNHARQKQCLMGLNEFSFSSSWWKIYGKYPTLYWKF